MNIAKAFVDWLQGLGYGTFGTDLYIGGVPLDAPTSAFWVLSAGGAPKKKNQTNEMRKDYVISLFYRNTDAEDVYETLQEIEEILNSSGCPAIGPYDTIEVVCNQFPTDNDLDAEDRTVGLLEVTITTYS